MLNTHTQDMLQVFPLTNKPLTISDIKALKEKLIQSHQGQGILKKNSVSVSTSVSERV